MYETQLTLATYLPGLVAQWKGCLTALSLQPKSELILKPSALAPTEVNQLDKWASSTSLVES